MSKYDRVIPQKDLLDDKNLRKIISAKKDVEYLLDEIEYKYGVEILYATMVGSRVYGYHHKNSDYNIRFVYKKPMDEYLKVVRPREVLRLKQDQYEASGYDIRRFLHQHYLSNPLIYEMVESPVKCRKDKIGFEELMPFDENVLLKRFYQIAQHNYNKAYVEIPYKLRLVNVKRYLYSIRYILMWNVLISQKKSPPLTLKELMMGNRHIGIDYIEFIVKFMDFYQNRGVGDIGYIELSNMNSWISNSLRYMRSTYPLRQPNHRDSYYYDKRFLDLVKQ